MELKTEMTGYLSQGVRVRLDFFITFASRLDFCQRVVCDDSRPSVELGELEDFPKPKYLERMLRSASLLICFWAAGLVGVGALAEEVGSDAVRTVNGLVVLRDSGEAFTGTVTKPIHYQHVMLMRYVDGKAQGIWERRTADGVVVSEHFYDRGAMDREKSERLILALWERNQKQYSNNPKALYFSAMGVAGHYYLLQRPDRALIYYQAALRHTKPMSVMASGAHVGVGRSCMRMRLYEQAELHLRKALAIREVQAGMESRSILWPLRELSYLYKDTADYQNAAHIRARMVRVKRKVYGVNSPETIEAQLEETEIWLELDRIPEAMKVSEDALGKLKGDSEEIVRLQAIAYRRLCTGMMRQDRDQEALQFAFKELDCLNRLPPQRQYWGSFLHRNIAMIYVKQGHHDKARKHLLGVMEGHRQLFGDQGRWFIESSTMVALANMELGKLAEAESVLRQVDVSEQRTAAQGSSWMKYFAAQCRLQMERDDPEAARPWARRMKRLHEKSIQRVVQYGSERQRGGAPAARPVYGTLADARDIDGLAESLLRTKGWVITSAKADLLAAYLMDDPEVKELLQQRRALHDELVESQVIQMLHQQRLDQKGLGGAVESVVMLPELTSQFEIQQQIDTVHQRIHDIARKQPGWLDPLEVTVKDLQQALPEDAVLLDYFFYNSHQPKTGGTTHYGCLIVTRGRPVRFVSLGPAEQVAELLSRLPNGRPQTESAFRGVMQALHRQLIAPVADQWPQGTRRLFICPDDNLNFLSFATVMDTDGEFLGEQYAVSYLHSSADLLLPALKAGNNQVKVFADSVYSATPDATAKFGFTAMRSGERGVFKPLPYTRSEARRVQAEMARRGGKVQLHLGLEATEKQLRAVRSPNILHIATHGITETGSDEGTMNLLAGTLADGTQSACLAFTGVHHIVTEWKQGRVPKVKEDGILGPDELSCLNLSGTTLVVLSACHTGQGNATIGQGMVGLRRSLAMAGARNILMTHWDVSDRWTNDFMAEFYARYSEHQRPSQALFEVQSKWLRDLRRDEGAKVAAQIAGPFFIATQGAQ